VWTLEEKGQSPNVDVTFDTAIPTISHRALVTLEHAGMLLTVLETILLIPVNTLHCVSDELPPVP